MYIALKTYEGMYFFPFQWYSLSVPEKGIPATVQPSHAGIETSDEKNSPLVFVTV